GDRSGRRVATADAQWPVVGREAATGDAVEAPSVEGAHELVAVGAWLDLPEHAQVGVAVRAATLHDVLTELDVRFDFGRRGGLSHGRRPRDAVNRPERKSEFDQSTARWPVTVSTSSRGTSNRNSYGSPAYGRTSA